jgi:hypothetical protein
MTSMLSHFTTSHEISSASPIMLPMGDIVPILHNGRVRLSPTLSLNIVLYVPDLEFNLLSISKLTKA